MQRLNRYPRSFAFRLDDATAERLAVVAAAHGMPPAAYARHVVVEGIGASLALPRVQNRVLHANILRQLIGELARLGSLMNQVARALNSGDRSRLAVLDEIRAGYVSALNAVTDALGGTRAP
jgi:hypothetical protein